jgi:hypothetical protein
MKARRMTLELEFAPRKQQERRIEHAAGETATMLQDAIDDLRPAVLRLSQRGDEHTAALIESAVTALELGKRHLAKLTRYAKEY